MSPTAVPSRITIDFRDAAMPSRTWILGVDEAATARMELIAFNDPGRQGGLPRTLPAAADVPPTVGPSALTADCLCPEFCERDHANE